MPKLNLGKLPVRDEERQRYRKLSLTSRFGKGGSMENAEKLWLYEAPQLLRSSAQSVPASPSCPSHVEHTMASFAFEETSPRNVQQCWTVRRSVSASECLAGPGRSNNLFLESVPNQSLFLIGTDSSRDSFASTLYWAKDNHLFGPLRLCSDEFSENSKSVNDLDDCSTAQNGYLLKGPKKARQNILPDDWSRDRCFDSEYIDALSSSSNDNDSSAFEITENESISSLHASLSARRDHDVLYRERSLWQHDSTLTFESRRRTNELSRTGSVLASPVRAH